VVEEPARRDDDGDLDGADEEQELEAARRAVDARGLEDVERVVPVRSE
jgi:hypothetical protein